MGGIARRGGDRIDEALLTLLAENAAAGRPCALATVVRTESPTSAHPGDKAVITADGELHGWIGGSCSEPLVRREALVAMGDGMPRLVRIRPDVEALETRTRGELTVATTCPSGGTLDIFIDPHLPKPLLVVIGGSPAARSLIALAGVMGFRTCGVDPGAGVADFPGADRVFDQLDLTPLSGDTDCWVVVATMGHYDDDGLAAALTLPNADVALVASERRSAAVFETLRGRGISDEQLARVRAPAGARRAGAQEEIALHALAEVVALRRERIAANPAAPSAVLTGFEVDPVCGMTVDSDGAVHTAAHNGEMYCFCCAGCQERFVADPARFLRAPAG
ncbi:MAG TPA: XdhC family protein [Candidatus Dormibacteraeota bacterium]